MGWAFGGSPQEQRPVDRAQEQQRSAAGLRATRHVAREAERGIAVEPVHRPWPQTHRGPLISVTGPVGLAPYAIRGFPSLILATSGVGFTLRSQHAAQ